MDGYRIRYFNSLGEEEETWMEIPVSSFDISYCDNKNLVLMFFRNVHPGCKVISCDYCIFEDF